MSIVLRLVVALRFFRGILGNASHNHVVYGFASGMRIILTAACLPLTLRNLLPSQLQKYVRLFRHTLKSCRFSTQATIALSRAKRASNPAAWVTQFKTTRRHFARSMP